MASDKAKSDKKNNVKKVEEIKSKDYSALNKQELVEVAKEYNLKNISKLNKTELQEKIQEFEAEKIKKQEKKIPNYKKSPYNEYSKQQLNELAKEYKIKNYSRMAKPELIRSIEKHSESASKSNDTTDQNLVENIEQNEENKPNENTLDSLNMSSLVNIAKDLKVKGYSKLSKLKLIKSINEIKNTVVEKVSELKDNIVETAETISEGVNKTKETVNQISQIVADKKDSLAESLENLSENISKTKETITHIVSEMKEAFNEDPVKQKESKKKTSKKSKTDIEEQEIKEIKELAPEEKEPVPDNLDNAQTIEKIAQKTELPFVDRREAHAVEIEEELKHKILLTPSKFGFGKTNEEFLLKDEENLSLPDLYEEDKITLLPVDPTKMFIYWDLATETIDKFNENGIRDFYLKVNDVTGVMYNGNNANLYWMEKCRIEPGNWYIYLNQGGRNFCVELGYIYNGEFNIIVRSNTVMVAPGKASEIVADTFVIASYPEPKAPTKEINNEFASDRYISRVSQKKSTPYYELNDYRIAQNYNLKRMAKKMPIFSLVDEIPQHFVEEYKIAGPSVVEVQEPTQVFSPPEKLPGEPPVFIQPQVNNYQPEILVPLIENRTENYYRDEQAQPVEQNEFREYELIKPQAEVLNETISYSEPLTMIRKEIPETIYHFFESIPGFSTDKILVDKHYYHIPGEPQKAIRVYYEWVENEVPYRKEFFWVSDTFPEVHQNIYKVSWGPTWVKEFIGGSEQIRYLGASERFLGGSEVFLGGSEWFIESSGRYIGSSEYYLGGSEEYSGGSENYIGSSDLANEWNRRFPGASEQMAGGSENYQKGSELVNLFSDEFVLKSSKTRSQDYKGIKDRYKL